MNNNDKNNNRNNNNNSNNNDVAQQSTELLGLANQLVPPKIRFSGDSDCSSS